MDLSSLDLAKAADNGFSVELKHPITNEALEHDGRVMSIRIVGRDSKKFRAIRNKLLRESIGKKKDVDLEEIEQQTAKTLAECTLSGDIFINGEWLSLNASNSEAIYMQYEWLRTQVDNAMADRANLLLDAKKN